MSDLAGNPNCWFSHAQAHVHLSLTCCDNGSEDSAGKNLGKEKVHYENFPLQYVYREIFFSEAKTENFIGFFFWIFLIFLLKTLIHFRTEAVLTSNQNLCFGAKIRKVGIPCKPQFSV